MNWSERKVSRRPVVTGIGILACTILLSGCEDPTEPYEPIDKWHQHNRDGYSIKLPNRFLPQVIDGRNLVTILKPGNVDLYRLISREPGYPTNLTVWSEPIGSERHDHFVIRTKADINKTQTRADKLATAINEKTEGKVMEWREGDSGVGGTVVYVTRDMVNEFAGPQARYTMRSAILVTGFPNEPNRRGWVFSIAVDRSREQKEFKMLEAALKTFRAA